MKLNSENISSMLERSKKISTENPQQSFELARNALYISMQDNLIKEQAYSLMCMAYASRVMSRYVEGLRYSFDALRIFIDINDIEGKIRAYNIIGIIYFYYGSYKQALEYMLNALELLKSTEDYFLTSCVLNNIGEIYREADDSNNAIINYNEALKISEKYGFEQNKAAIMLNIGKIYSNLKKYSESLDFFYKSRIILLNTNDIVTQGEVECEIGKIMYSLGHLDIAKKHYFTALKKLHSIQNKFYIIDVLVNIGILEATIYGNAIEYFNIALKYAEEIKSDTKISMLYKHLSSYYSNQNDYKSALDFFKKYHYKEQEIEASNLARRLEIKKLEYEYNKKKNEVENLRHLSKTLEDEISVSFEKVEKLKVINEKLKKETIIDELTGIYNRRGLNQKLKELIDNHNNSKEHIVIFLIDIDRFKKYNDYWGHLQGDKCIIDICKCINNIQHKDSFFGRYGGEEFLYIAKAKDFEYAVMLGEKIRKKVGDLNIKYNGNINSDNVTISIGGVYTSLSPSKSIHQLIDAADSQLYHAKNEGRNKVCVISLDI